MVILRSSDGTAAKADQAGLDTLPKNCGLSRV
jgi:hypothetical protein